MDKSALVQQLCHFEVRRLVLLMAIVVSAVVATQFFALPFGSLFAGQGSLYSAISNVTQINISNSNSSSVIHAIDNDDELKGTVSYNNLDDSLDSERKLKDKLILEKGTDIDKRLAVTNAGGRDESSNQVKDIISRHEVSQNGGNSTSAMRSDDQNVETSSNLEELKNRAGSGNPNPNSEIPVLFGGLNSSSMDNVVQNTETKSKDPELLQLVTRNDMRRKTRLPPISISQMNLILALNARSSISNRPRWSMAGDQELLSAKLKIENAPILRNYSESYTAIYRNVSKFTRTVLEYVRVCDCMWPWPEERNLSLKEGNFRSYELMESTLKIYIYREGEKPIFHQSKQNGIYASEGWFMKLMEGNKQFVVKDPKKANLFFLPFSSKMLRTWLDEQNVHSWKELQIFLDKYVDTISAKYPFWNRTSGSDHFLVACHDWAPRITRNRMRRTIRSLCNSNMIRGFEIGKDTSLPVTYIRGGNLQSDFGGKPPSQRNILAFFAGSMHGYFRPILLKYWENKEPDMKIFGPMPRDRTGTTSYKEYMKSSKYCICARGYEVHTPRVVEAIVHECVPVIIADNYIPPFFEVLNWESFAVFVEEDDVANLRNILLSISDEKYLAMHERVKIVQQHFIWHREPVKYDLFHMILHSVWFNRVSQVKIK